MERRIRGIAAFSLSLAVTACSGDDTATSATATETDTDTDGTTDGTGTATTTTTTTTTAGTTTTTTTTGDTTSPTTTTTTTSTTDPTTTSTSETTTTAATDVTATDTDGPSCVDGAQNGDESDVDCGGSCSPCADGQMCGDNVDCASGLCEGGVCAAIDPCANGVLDGDESDVDCGGSCSPCEGGAMCNGDGDCVADCVDGICSTPECLEDLECAGLDSECSMGTCVDFACVASPINEAGPCDDGDLCTEGSICTAGACGGGTPPDCSGLDGQCGLGICDPNSGQCVVDPVADETPCVSDLGCSGVAACMGGACVDPGGEAFFYEPFANNDKGWTLDTEWAIGAAVAGCGDPGTDHSPTDDNGVAGVILGGCAATTLHDYYCITSPTLDVGKLNSLSMSYWRDLYSDYTPYMKNKIEVWNGDSWVILFETFGNPGVNDAQWTFFEYDLTPHLNPALQVRWCHNIGSGGAFQRGSWNIDDVVLGPQGCVPY